MPALAMAAVGSLFCSPILFIIHLQIPHMYYDAYYVCDIVCVGLYSLAAVECLQSRNHNISAIGVLMILYNIPDVLSLPFLPHHLHMARAIQNALKYANIATFLIYSALLMNRMKELGSHESHD